MIILFKGQSTLMKLTVLSFREYAIYNDYYLKHQGQCYETFYVPSLRIFIVSYSVCLCQAFPA